MPSHDSSHDRKVWADLCRVVAIFGVILIHACGATFYQFGKITELDWLSANFLDSLVRCSVPLFVMLSGALLLKKDTPLATPQQILIRIRKVGIPLLTWSVAYLYYVSYYTGEAVDFLSILKQPSMYHLWFVYMLIGLYFLIPILQAIFQAIISRRDVQIYLLFLWLVISGIQIWWPLPFLSLLYLTSLLGYGGYFLIGGVVGSIASKKKIISPWILVYFISVLVTFFITWNLSSHSNSVDERAYLYFSPNVFIASVSAFIILTRIHINNSKRVLSKISDLCFLIFFIHVVVLERVQNYMLSLNLFMPSIINILANALLTFGLCFVIALVIRLLPKSKVILG